MAEKVEVVIKIPKYYLEHPQDYSCLAECVRRGTVLPKGHGRLKDVDAIIKKSWDVDCRCGFVQVVDVGEILEATTIIEADKAESE